MAPSEQKVVAQKMVAKKTSTGGNADLYYQIYVPDLTNIGSKKIPLVLALHSAAGNGTDNFSQIDRNVETLVSDQFQKHSPSIVVAPQCPPGVQWTNIPFGTSDNHGSLSNYSVDDYPESNIMKSIVQLLATISEELPVDEDKIYLTGFSMGSSAAWDMLARHPKLFAGAVTMSGVSDPSQAPSLSHIPIWVFHGRFDKVSPIQNSIDMVDALKEHNAPVRFNKLLWGHNIQNIVTNDNSYLEWLFEQTRKQI